MLQVTASDTALVNEITHQSDMTMVECILHGHTDVVVCHHCCLYWQCIMPLSVPPTVSMQRVNSVTVERWPHNCGVKMLPWNLFPNHPFHYFSLRLAEWPRWLGGVVVRALGSWSRGRGFDSDRGTIRATTLGKLFTPNVPLFTKHSDAQGWVSECLDVKNYKWRLNPVWQRMLHSCTRMATMVVKGLNFLRHD